MEEATKLNHLRQNPDWWSLEAGQGSRAGVILGRVDCSKRERRKVMKQGTWLSPIQWRNFRDEKY